MGALHRLPPLSRWPIASRLIPVVVFLLLVLLVGVVATYFESTRERRDAEVENMTALAHAVAGSVDAFAVVTPPIVSEIGTVPAEIPAGTVTFTWYNPGNPGASPLNCTGASWPPIVTLGGFFVVASVVPLAGPPLAG